MSLSSAARSIGERTPVPTLFEGFDSSISSGTEVEKGCGLRLNPFVFMVAGACNLPDLLAPPFRMEPVGPERGFRGQRQNQPFGSDPRSPLLTERSMP